MAKDDSKRKKKRLQFDFSEEEVEQIDELVRRFNLASRAELFRGYLKVMKVFADVKDDDGEVILQRKGERLNILLIL